MSNHDNSQPKSQKRFPVGRTSYRNWFWRGLSNDFRVDSCWYCPSLPAWYFLSRRNSNQLDRFCARRHHREHLGHPPRLLVISSYIDVPAFLFLAYILRLYSPLPPRQNNQISSHWSPKFPLGILCFGYLLMECAWRAGRDAIERCWESLHNDGR